MDTGSASLGELLATYRHILRELRVRGVLGTDEQPTAGYAELLVASHYQGSRTPEGGTPWDVLAGDGRRLKVRAQIPAVTGDGPSRALAAIRSWDFDLLLVVLFEDTYGIARAIEMPASAAESAASFAPKRNGYVVLATDEFLAEHGTDITAALQEAQSSI